MSGIDPGRGGREREALRVFLYQRRNVPARLFVPAALFDKSTSVRIKELHTDPA